MKKKMLNIYFIRHGLSCANVVETLPVSFLRKRLLKPKNPRLADLAYWQMKDLEKTGFLKLLREKCDFFYTSDMLRAIETGQLLFPAVEVLPWVCEKSLVRFLDPENQAETPQQTKKRLEWNGDVDYKFYNHVIGNSSPPSASWRKFKERVIMKHWMNIESPFYLFENKSVVNVCIVSHSHFISALPIQDWKPRIIPVHERKFKMKARKKLSNFSIVRITVPRYDNRNPRVEGKVIYNPVTIMKDKELVELNDRKRPYHLEEEDIRRCPEKVKNAFKA